MSHPSPPIPNRLLFVWLGARFPLVNLVAMRSALAHCSAEEVVLIADGVERDDPQLGELASEPRLRVIRPEEVLRRSVPGFSGGLESLYAEMTAPAARANILRLAELFHGGGIYLDTDTITVRDLGALRGQPGFCGLETLALPREVAEARNPWTIAKTGLRVAARKVCARLPRPDRAFAPLERMYPRAVNNAVLGACPNNELIGSALARMATLDARERRRRFRLGTHLMQEVTENRSSPQMQVLDPHAFYPLGPEVSVAWFRPGSAARLDELVTQETFVVHWYASLESRLSHPLDSDWIRGAAGDVAFATLAAPWIH